MSNGGFINPAVYAMGAFWQGILIGFALLIAVGVIYLGGMLA
jgi:hypothetical protein